MRWFKNLLFRICAVARRRQIEMDLADELKFHLETEIEKNVAAGMNPEEARYAAARSFGDIEQVKEECRDLIGVRFIVEAWQDVRYGLRMLAKSPGFSAVAVLCLALGIGANTAIFSLIDVALLRPLPLDQPDQLVLVDVAGSQGTGEAFSYPTYQMFRDHNEVFSGMLAFDVVLGPLTAHVNGPAELADGQLVSGNYFSVLGVKALLGRTLAAEDDQGLGPGGSQGLVAVISYGYWKRLFALDSTAIGKVITLNNTPFTIVGVLPRDFFGTVVGRSPDIYLPLVMQPQIQRLGKTGSVLSEPEVSWLRIMGRRKPGITEQQARSNVEAIFRQIQNEAVGGPETQPGHRPASNDESS
jgi:MacB-like periplasmic core domain